MCPRLAQQQLQEQQQAARDSFFLRKIKNKSKMLWNSERTRKMRESSWSSWAGPLCLPMLFALQPLTDYNLRTCLALAFLAFIAWTRLSERGGKFAAYYYPSTYGISLYSSSRDKRKHSTASPGGGLAVRKHHHHHHHGHHKSGKPFHRGHEKHCEKCDQRLLEQLTDGVKPVVSWNVRACRRLPLRLVSRHWGRLANADSAPRLLTLLLVWIYSRLFRCRLEEAERSDIRQYRSLGDFFCRRLRPGARPIALDAEAVSPSDGAVTHSGEFAGGFLQQVKGVHYSLNYFLGLEGPDGAHRGVHASCDGASLLHHTDGSTRLFQWVVYLSPGDYHRFHSPADWSVERRRHFPGELLSVKPGMVSAFPGLFHLNERVAWLGRWRHGFFSMTAVGATNVGSIHADFEPELRTNQAASVRRECTMASACSRRSFYFSQRDFAEGEVEMRRGQDFGHFSFGSTIVLVFEAPRDFRFSAGEGRVWMGQAL